jgi:quercetin dioxygenase-like cupin family protein
MTSYDLKSMATKSPAAGVEIRVIPGKNMTMAFFSLAPGAVVPEHSHPHEQIGTILKGSIELTIAGEKKLYVPGQAWHVPGDVVHSGQNQDEPAEVIEVFSPAREDMVSD